MYQVVYMQMNILHALHNLKIHPHDDIGIDFFSHKVYKYIHIWRSIFMELFVNLCFGRSSVSLRK